MSWQLALSGRKMKASYYLAADQYSQVRTVSSSTRLYQHVQCMDIEDIAQHTAVKLVTVDDANDSE